MAQPVTPATHAVSLDPIDYDSATNQQLYSAIKYNMRRIEEINANKLHTRNSNTRIINEGLLDIMWF